MGSFLLAASLLVFSALFIQGAVAQPLYYLTPTPLDYSQSRTVDGSGTATQTPSGIMFSGTGKIIVKLNDIGGQMMLINGTMPAGAKLRLAEKFFTYDLATLPYDSTYGFRVATGLYTSTMTWYGYTYCGNCRPGPARWQGFSSDSASAGVTFSSQGNAAWSPSISGPSGTQYPNSWVLNSLYQGSDIYQNAYYDSHTVGTTSSQGPISYYDRYPATDLLTFTASFPSYAQQTTAGKQYYLVAEPNGGTITLTGNSYAETDGRITKNRTLDFFGSAKTKSGSPLSTGSAKFTVVTTNGTVVWGPLTSNGLVSGGFLQYAVGAVSPLMVVLGDGYKLKVQVSDRAPFLCTGGAVCEEFEVPFTG